MNDDDQAKRVDELMKPGSTLMFGVEMFGVDRVSGVDRQGARLEFRPMTVARVSADTIDMLLDTDEEWARSLRDGDAVYVTLSDNRTNTWVSLHGDLSVSTDPALIDELWNPAAEAYFDDGRDTPGIAVLSVAARSGRYWSSPSGRVGSLISMVKAAIGDAEDTGEHGDVAVGGSQ